MQNLADVNANLQPLSQLRRRHYQGTPTYASADLQPLSHLTVPAPLTQGSLSKYVQTLFSGTRQCLPCVRGGGPPVAVEGLSMAAYAT